MTTSTVALPKPARPANRHSRRTPTTNGERRGWQAFWALPAITALLLAVHGGRIVEIVYLPLALLLGTYLCLKFPRVYLAFALMTMTLSPMVNRIAAWQSVLMPKSPILAAPFLVVALGALKMWKRWPSGYRLLVFGLPVLAVFYGAAVGVLTLGVKAVVGPLAGWMSAIIFGMYCYTNEDDRGSLAKMFLGALMVAGVVIAVYGVVQYASPAQWDTEWLSQMQEQGSALSMGKPEAFAIRVFSMVSSPAAAALFLVTALLALTRLRSRGASSPWVW